MMLTGDHNSSAWKVANVVGINEVYYSFKREDKLAHMKEISRKMMRLLTHRFMLFAICVNPTLC